MVQVALSKELKEKYIQAVGRLDDDVRELEEIQEEMDKMLYDIEKRIAAMRRPSRA